MRRTVRLFSLLASLTTCCAFGEPPWVQQFRTLPPTGRLAAYTLLTEWQVLQQAGAAAVAEGQQQQHSFQELAELKQQQLRALLPQLDATNTTSLQLHATASGLLLSDLQRAAAPKSRLARALTLVNIAWFCGCVLVVLAVVSLVGVYLAALVFLIPLPAWEVLGYAASLWTLRAATGGSPAAAPYVGLTGLLLLTACIGGSIFLHLADKFKNNETAAAGLMGFFALLYGLVAVRLQSSLLGTLSVWWAVSALGFSIFVFPFLTVVGFRNGMLAPFSASLALILAFLPFKVAPDTLPTPAFLRPFETGVWLWCVLVVNLANLILSHQQWERSGGGGIPAEAWAQLPLRVKLRIVLYSARRHLASQVPAVAVIGGTLACGLLLDVEQCRALGSVFGFLWFLSKLAECDWKRVGFAWSALAFGSVLWAAAYAVHTWPHAFMLTGKPASA